MYTYHNLTRQIVCMLFIGLHCMRGYMGFMTSCYFLRGQRGRHHTHSLAYREKGNNHTPEHGGGGGGGGGGGK